MTRIRFQGTEYLLTGTTGSGGAITTEAAFQAGQGSFAHLMQDGRIMRFGRRIGTVADVEVIGPASVGPFDVVSAIHSLLTGKS